jgi:hypothetical protein
LEETSKRQSTCARNNLQFTSGIRDGVAESYSSLRTIRYTRRIYCYNILGTDSFQYGKDGGGKFMDIFTQPEFTSQVISQDVTQFMD